jgi:hypothetical protein
MIRWFKASRAMKKEEHIYVQRLAEMARKHSKQALSSNVIIKGLIFAIFQLLPNMWEQSITSLLAILKVSRQVPQQHLLFIPNPPYEDQNV